jgi:hypothetical protein
MPTEQMRRAASPPWCGSALNISLLYGEYVNAQMLPFFLAHSGLSPQVPGDVHDAGAGDAEVPAAAAAAPGAASEGLRRFHSGSEVPELYGVFVCCYA